MPKGIPKIKVTTSESLEDGKELLPLEKIEEEVVVEHAGENPVSKKVGVQPCLVCSSPQNARTHEKTFDGPGVGHWPFSPGTKAERQFNFLANEPKISIFIPLLSGEKRGTLQTPTVNGLKIGIRKGQYVELPKGLADIIMESLSQTAKAETETMLAPNPYTGQRRLARLDQQDDISREILGQ